MPSGASFLLYTVDIITAYRYSEPEREGTVTMIISELLKKRNMTKYRLSKLSNVCHKIKCLGDIDFLIDTLRSNAIPEFLRFNIVESEIRNVN